MKQKTFFCLPLPFLFAAMAACSAAESAAPAVELTIKPTIQLTEAGEIETATSSGDAEFVESDAAFDGTLAYIEDQALIIHHPDGERTTVETCPQDAYCITQFLKWSPDGQAVVFLRPTDEHIEGSETSPPFHVHEVWTAVLDASGIVQEPQLVGSTNRLEDGCGGGGRSASEVLYENEGGTAYGYLMGVMEWTASGTLLYTNNCTNIGINRFDMNSGEDLPPFEVELRNLITDESGNKWFAITGPTWPTETESHQIAVGKPEETAVTIIPTQHPVELLFYGSQSDKLYYTTRELVEGAEISDLGAYFHFFKSALWQINQDGSEESLLWQGEDQGYAQVAETANGNLLFVLVENDRPLYEALQNGSATMDEMGEYAPQRHIMSLVIGGEPHIGIRSAGLPELAPGNQ